MSSEKPVLRTTPVTIGKTQILPSKSPKKFITPLSKAYRNNTMYTPVASSEALMKNVGLHIRDEHDSNLHEEIEKVLQDKLVELLVVDVCLGQVVR